MPRIYLTHEANDFRAELDEMAKANVVDEWDAEQEMASFIENAIEDYEATLQDALRRVVQEFLAEQPQDCGDCEATGTCPFCQGDGKCSTYHPDDDHTNCKDCEGTNECFECEQRGNGVCATCDGDGRV